MSEMEYENPPVVIVPKVRPFVHKALADWKRGVWPRHRGVFVWGIFAWAWAIGLLFKVFIYLFGIALILVAYPIWVTAELITYRYRLKREGIARWSAYLDLELPG